MLYLVGNMRGPRSGPAFLPGRDEELNALRKALREARSGRAQLVVIDGPSGIGKSALLAAFLDNEAQGGQVIWLRCDQLEQDISFSAAELLLGEAVDASCSELEVGRRLLARLGDARLGDARLGDTRHADDITVVAVDDAHWMDGPSARAFRFALGRLRVEPVLAVVARRPGSSDVDLLATEDPGATTVLRPEPLDRAAVHHLANRIRGWILTDTTADHVLEQTGGSPLLISSVMRHATDLGQLESWTGVPATATTAAARMLGSLHVDSRALVEAAAVLAEPADLVTLGGIAEVSAPAPRIGAASAAGLLTVDGSGAVSSTHALLREAVYDSLPLGRRQALHARAAEWTSGDRRLVHRAAAASRPDPVLVTELIAAADLARSSRRYDLAATHRLRARSISADPAERDTLLYAALIDRVSAQDLDGADELAEQAAALTPTPLRSLALGLLARERGRVGEARSYLHEARAESSGVPDPRIRQQAAVAAAGLHVRMNEGALALAALEDLGEIDDPDLAGDARINRGLGLWQAGDIKSALAQLAADPISAEGSAWEAELLGARGVFHLYAGALSEALTDLDQAIGMSHLWRPSTNQPRIYVMRCLVRYYRGDWDGALGDAAAARALAAQAEVWSVAWARGVSIDVPANRGQWDIATDHLAEARAAMARLPNIQVVDLIARHESLIYAARGEHDAVLAVLEPLLSENFLLQLAAFRSYRFTLPAWIISCIEVGRLADAERELDRYAAMLHRWPGGVGPERLGWLRGLLAQARGEPDAARAHFGADLSDPELTAMPFLHAQLRQAAGRLEQAAGRRREAIRHLTIAHGLFSQLRARPFVDRCRVDLAASGLRSASTDPQALTEREEDVAALVSRGYTNKEVARELFVSPKAVEYHLRGIYSKLGISTRGELRRLRTAVSPWPQSAGSPTRSDG